MIEVFDNFFSEEIHNEIFDLLTRPTDFLGVNSPRREDNVASTASWGDAREQLARRPHGLRGIGAVGALAPAQEVDAVRVALARQYFGAVPQVAPLAETRTAHP